VIALVGSSRSVAVVRVTDTNALEYRSVKSSKAFEIGNLPSLGTVFDLKARTSLFTRRSWLVVEFADGAVYTARLSSKMKLGGWIPIFAGRPVQS
jgi:hypothetical protein